MSYIDSVSFCLPCSSCCKSFHFYFGPPCCFQLWAEEVTLCFYTVIVVRFPLYSKVGLIWLVAVTH